MVIVRKIDTESGINFIIFTSQTSTTKHKYNLLLVLLQNYFLYIIFCQYILTGVRHATKFAVLYYSIGVI